MFVVKFKILLIEWLKAEVSTKTVSKIKRLILARLLYVLDSVGSV